MFDVGEGVQRQMTFTPINAGTVDKIFITHMHADHVLGLPGLLLGMNLVQKAKATRRTVDIYGPPGLYDYIGMTVNLTHSGLDQIHIVVHELTGSDDALRESHTRKNTYYRQNVTCITVPRQEDGTWILQDAIDAPTIKAAEVIHLKGIKTYGFTVQEQDAKRTINAEKAIALGLRPGQKFRELKCGKSVLSDDGSRWINPEDVLEDHPRKNRKFTLVGDNFALTAAMKQLAQESDVLVHEATLTKEQMERGEARIRGHSSAEMAGTVAKAVGAKCLVLNHISAKMKTKLDIIDLRNRAKERSGDSCDLIVAHDFLELLIPPLGFDQIERDDSKQLE
jgi:ribonuclease Z